MKPRREWAIPARLWYTLALQLVAVVILAGLGSWYVEREGNQDDHRWCELISTLDEGYSSNPQQPTTPRGQKLRQDIHKLRADLGC